MENKSTMKIWKGDICFEVEPIPFWQQVILNNWEPETYEIMKKYIDKDHSYIDIGAWIGPTILFGAQLAKECYAFEPDPIAYAALERNLDLNPHIHNIITNEKAVTSGTGVLKLGAKGEYGDSMSSLLWSKNPVKVDTISLEQIFFQNKITDCNFIKMDIEGGEYLALPSAKEVLQKFKPTLYLSLHTPWFENKNEYLIMIMNVLSIYQNIYNIKGEKIALEDIWNLTGFTAIIASDL